LSRNAIISAVVLSALVVGCGKFMGNLRRDLDDSEPPTQPTYGGRFSEAGFLSDDYPETPGRYAALGHSERGPASADRAYDASAGGTSWVSPAEADANARDRNRYGADDDGQTVSMSNTPQLNPPVRRQYKNGLRATRADFIDDSSNEGSLWGSDGQTNYYFTKNKVRGIGDIVTVTLEPDLLKDVYAEVRRTLNPRERDAEMALAQDRIRAKTLGLPDPDPKKEANTPGAPNSDQLATAQAAAQRAPAGTEPAKPPEDKDIRPATASDIDVSRSLDIKSGDTMMAEILERYPNGNYKIRGTKRIQYKSGPPRMVSVVAVARGQDITEEDTITSGKLYEYRIESMQ
jgi:flagellar basal body L-ring protein FlgH